MLPAVVICGRTNVGKSTLFNRMLYARRAVVGDRPGITLDCIRAHAPDGRVWIDSAGLESGARGVASQAWLKTRDEIASGCAVVMVVDARTGLLPEDAELACQLRKMADPQRILLAVNKAENLDLRQVAAEFLGMGFAGVYAVSAMHNQGLGELKGAVDLLAPAETGDAPAANAVAVAGTGNEEALCSDIDAGSRLPNGGPEQGPLKIALLGRPNVGKSTLANRMSGSGLMIVDDRPGTTVDCVELPFEHHGRKLVLIDAAGVRRRSRVTGKVEESSAAFASQSARRADIVLLVLDASQEVAHQDKLLAERVGRRGNAVLVLLNKTDLLDGVTVTRVTREARRQLPHLRRVRFLPISAASDSFDSSAVVDAAFAAHKEAVNIVKTARVTAVLQDAVSHAKPPHNGRSRPRLRFARQVGVNPPEILVHGRHVADVPESYRRYLASTFAAKLGFANSAVHVRLSESGGRRAR